MPEVLRLYLSDNSALNVFQPLSGIREGDQRATIEHFGIRPNPPQTGGPVEFIFSIERSTANKSDLWVDMAVGIRSEEGAPLLIAYSRDMAEEFPLSSGRTEITVRLEQLLLAPGRYRVNAWMGAGQFVVDRIQDCMLLCVEPGPLVGNRYIEYSFYPIVVPSRWERST